MKFSKHSINAIEKALKDAECYWFLGDDLLKRKSSVCDKYFHFGKVNYVAKAVEALGGNCESFANRSEAIKFIISKMNELQKRNQVEIIETGMDYTTFPSMSSSFNTINVETASEKEIDDYLSFHLQADNPDYFGGFNKVSTPDLFDVYFKSKQMKKDFENNVSNYSDIYAIVFMGDGNSFYKSHQKDFQKFFSLEFFQYFRASDLKAFIEFADSHSDFENKDEIIDEESEKENCQKFKKFGDILRCILEEDNAVFEDKSNMWQFEWNTENVLPDEGDEGYSSDIPDSSGIKRKGAAEITPEQDNKRMKAMLGNVDKESYEVKQARVRSTLTESDRSRRKREKMNKFQQHEIYHVRPSVSKQMQAYFDRDIQQMPKIMSDKLKDHIPHYKERKRSKFTLSSFIYLLMLLCGTIGFFDAIGNKAYDPFMSSCQRDTIVKCNNLIERVIKTKERILDMQISSHVESNFMTSCAKEQVEIICNLAFEAKNRNEQPFVCMACKGSFIFNPIEIETKPLRCEGCEQRQCTRPSLLKNNLLPVWKERLIDGTDKIHYELPEILKDLTLGEKLLIQKNSCLIPCYHLYKGTFGIKGHSVMFPKDFENICNILPRQRNEVLKICKQYKIPSSDHYSAQLFKVRKSVIIEALSWLQQHHPGYKDIVVKESNLDWLSSDEDVLISDDEIENESDVQESANVEIETVAKDQTEYSEEDVDFYGVALQYSENTYNEDSVQLLKTLNDVESEKKNKIPILDFPQVSEEPIDEFKSINVFADCYPWLFPGGLGDISYNVRDQKKDAIHWTSILLRYYDGRFARDPCFSFHILNYLQRHINNRDGIAFMKKYFKDDSPSVEDIRKAVNDGDYKFIGKLQNFSSTTIRGSDGWWRKRKYELDDWVTYHLHKGNGPPTLFLTFSCAEYWWKDLEDFLLHRCANTLDQDLCKAITHGTDEERKTAKCKMIDRYTYCVQEFFQKRMDNWLETVGRKLFHLKHYYLRFEFAKGRGQIHAHILAITKNQNCYLTEHHHETTVKKDKLKGDAIYSEYARNMLCLSAEMPSPDSLQSLEKNALGSYFSQTQSKQNDLCTLCKKTHIHECGAFCLRYCKGDKRPKKEQRRQCRAGCGKEKTPNKGDTPGYKHQEYDSIDFDYKRNVHIFNLKRKGDKLPEKDPERFLKPMSSSMLQSWRANCDVSIIVYNCDVDKLCPDDLARVTGYVVSYCTKGNVTYKTERKRLLKFIENYESDNEDDPYSSLQLTRKMLNSFISTRLIAKPEASCELLGLNLYWCTESFRNIYVNKAVKVMNTENGRGTVDNEADNIEHYMKRSGEEHVSMKQFLTRLAEAKKKKVVVKDAEKERIRKQQYLAKDEIFHPVGMNGSPCYPVSAGYAKTTLLLHKPWSQTKALDFDENPQSLFDEFFDFLGDERCPLEVHIQFSNAMEKYFRLQNNHEPLIYEDYGDNYDRDFEVSNTYLAFMHAHNNVRIVPSELKSLYKGEDYDFSKQHVQFDHNLAGKDWLSEKKAIYDQQGRSRKSHIFHKTKRPYCIDDIGDNAEQEEIVYAILHKIQEWLLFPERHKQDQTTQFNPLFLTVRGEGGTGKSHIVKIVTNIIEDMFETNTMGVVAPTGNAAFNVGGKTCHSFFKIFPNNIELLIPEHRQELIETLKRQLLIFIDERSMLSTDVLGAIERNCSSAAHGGCNGHKLPFGGIPIIVLFGDDMQLPSVVKWGVGYGASHAINQDGSVRNILKSSISKKGARAFLTLSSNVITLKKNCRIEAAEYKLKNFCSSVRNKGGLTETDAKDLLKYHISNPELSQERRQYLFHKAMWIYTTNAEVTEHNQAMLRTLVNRDNPLMSFCAKYKKRAKGKSHFDQKARAETSVFLCRGCRVSISRNLWQEVGLYNGATGTVVDIRMAAGCTPLQGDLPAYVIVDMDTYTGPVWDERNPTYVPIPLSKKHCDKDDNCCILEYIPIELAFARTLHKFQGQTVGPGHNNECMVFNPGTSRFEGSNPGLFYVGLSRVTTLGSSIEDSSFYLAGGNADLDRLTDLIHFRCSKYREYARVAQRSSWIEYLNKKEKQTNLTLSLEQKSALKTWLQSKPCYSKIELDTIITYHNKHR